MVAQLNSGIKLLKVQCKGLVGVVTKIGRQLGNINEGGVSVGESRVVQAGVGGATSWLVTSVLVGAWGVGTGTIVVEIVAEVRPGLGVPGPRGRQGPEVSMVVRATTGLAARIWEACKGV